MKTQLPTKHFLAAYEAVMAHAQAEYPREACGLLVRVKRRVVYRPCRNAAPLSQVKDRFQVHPEDYAAAEDEGTVLAVVHSHPDADCHPSEADRWMCHRSGLAWYVVAVPGGAWMGMTPDPLPLKGRQFEHGVVDCYTLVRDYYEQTLDIELPDFERQDEWWKAAPGSPRLNLYRDNFAKAGFLELGQVQPQRHDVLLMQVAADVENHAAVYVGDVDGTGPRILHHLYGRLSGHDVWGGYWARHTTTVLRHGSLIGGGSGA